MVPMPGVEREDVVERHRPAFRMFELALKIRRLHRAQQANPTCMQRLEDRERCLDRRRVRVAELRPAGVVVWPDGRYIFGQRELEAAIRVEMTVGHVVDDLTDRPATFAVWRVELRRR